MRLQKFLSRAGVASRRESESLMLQGRVRVNGVVAAELGTKVDPDADTVELDGARVTLPPAGWVAYHKPRGVVTTRNDPQGRTTVFDALEGAPEGLRYVGRLDLDSEGLLLLTNQGDVLHRLTHPSFEIEREYLATLNPGPQPPALVRRLESGVQLEDGPARAVRATWADSPDPTVRLVLAEGRNREVRRMLDAVGRVVVRLRRVRYGPVELGSLPAGEWRELTERERRNLRRAVGLGGE